MKNREYIEAMIKVLSFAIDNKRLSNKDGENLAGELWQNIKTELSNSNVIFLEYGKEVNLLTTDNVKRKLNESRMILKEIQEKEYDRELENKSKKDAYRMAKWSIVISILAATGLPQMIFQWLFELIKELF
jgi:thiamine kinase-like enzyme